MAIKVIALQTARSVKGSVCQGLVVDWAPTVLQNGPKGSVVSTPLPIKLLILASPSDSNLKVGCVREERTLWLSQSGQAQLGLSCEASKCSDAGTGDLGVLPTEETSSKQDKSAYYVPHGLRKCVHLTCTICDRHSPVYARNVLAKSKIQRDSSILWNGTMPQHASLITHVYLNGLSAHFEIYSTFPNRPLSWVTTNRWVKKLDYDL